MHEIEHKCNSILMSDKQFEILLLLMLLLLHLILLPLLLLLLLALLLLLLLLQLLSPQGDTVFAGDCLFVCQQFYAKSYERISMKFSGSVGGGTRNNPLDFGS